MSSIRTAIAPSFAGRGGGGGKRGRDGGDDERRRSDKPKPLDKISVVDLGPEGRLRQLILLLLQIANLGELPSSSLLTRGTKTEKTLSERAQVVGSWVSGQMNASHGLKSARYTELAEAWVHVLRAINSAGLFDQFVAMMVEILTGVRAGSRGACVGLELAV